MARPGDYVVSMGDIIIPNVVEITMLKNMINMNPRGIIDVDLWADIASGFMPGICVIKTRTNVEDYFRYNTPFCVIKKIQGRGEVLNFITASLSYLSKVKYFGKTVGATKDGQKLYDSFVKLLAFGYISVFIGVVKTFHQATSSSGNNAGYEFIIGAQDLGSFLEFPFVNKTAINTKTQSGNRKIDVIPAFYSTPDPNDAIWTCKRMEIGVHSKKFSARLMNNGIGEDVVGRTPFIHSILQYNLDNSPQYEDYYKKLSILSLKPIVGLSSTPEADEIGALYLMKSLGELKVPISGEHQNSTIPAEAIPEHIAQQITETNIHPNTSISNIIRDITPKYFYETFVREDTGEFIFRRANWYGDKNFLQIRQSFQNPITPIVPPWGSLVTYQKLYGGKMGENAAYKVGTITQFGFADVITGFASDKNFSKFGQKINRDFEIFPNPNCHTYNAKSTTFIDKSNGNPINNLQTTWQFFGSDYYKINDNLVSWTGISKPDSPTPKEAAGKRMINWMSKYLHSHNYYLWMGFSTYFIAPIGSVVFIPSLPLINQHAPSLVPLPALGDATTMTSGEESGYYRIVGKCLKVAYREDGSYSEEYNILCANCGLGMKQGN